MDSEYWSQAFLVLAWHIFFSTSKFLRNQIFLFLIKSDYLTLILSGETEGLVDRQVGLDDEHGGAGGLGLLEHMSSPPVQDSVESHNSILVTLNLHLGHRLQQPGLGGDHGGVQHPHYGGDGWPVYFHDG